MAPGNRSYDVMDKGRLLVLLATMGLAPVVDVAGDETRAGKRGAQDSRFTMHRSEDGVEARESGKPVLFFQTKMKSLDGKWPEGTYRLALDNEKAKAALPITLE